MSLAFLLRLPHRGPRRTISVPAHQATRRRAGGGHRVKLREKIIAQLKQRQNADPELVQHLETQLAELDRQIKQGTERLLKSPEDITDLLAPQLSAWQKERHRLPGEIAADTRQSAPQTSKL